MSQSVELNAVYCDRDLDSGVDVVINIDAIDAVDAVAIDDDAGDSFTSE